VKGLLDGVLIADQFIVELGFLLLEHVFIGLRTPESLINDRPVRKYLVTEFYQILREKLAEYVEDLKDFSKNADEHHLIQIKIKKITEVCLSLRKKEYHDDIIYYMTILV
jgi:hypothetical protein